jgi:hypothetical protein
MQYMLFSSIISCIMFENWDYALVNLILWFYILYRRLKFNDENKWSCLLNFDRPYIILLISQYNLL